MNTNLADDLKKKMVKGSGFKKLTAWFVFGAIILVFVFFGFTSKMGKNGGALGYAARVNDSLVSIADYMAEEQRIQQYYAQLFGGKLDVGMQRQLFQGQAMESLVRLELANQAAHDEGLRATDAEVRDYIVNKMVFLQKDGKFNRDFYDRYLEATHSNPGDFETRIRKEINNIRMRRMMEVSTIPLNIEQSKMKELKENKLNVSFVKLDQAELSKKHQASDAEVTSQLANAEFKKKVQDHYNSHKSEFKQEPEVRARHILIGAKSGDEGTFTKALEKIKAIQERLKKEPFEKVAEAVSEDPGSKVKGGDLGFFGHGAMVPEFEKTAFSLPIGQVSEPVRSTFGYHLIKVLEKKEAKESKLEEVENKIARQILGQEKVDKMLTDLDKALTQGDASSVEQSIKALGANWEETGFFDLSVDSVPKISSAQAVEAVFELNDKSPLLKRLVRDGNLKYVLRFKERKVESLANKKEPSKKDGTNKNAIADNSDGNSADMMDAMGGGAGDAPQDKAAQKQRADSIFNSWIDSFRKISKIEINPQVTTKE